MIPDLCKSNLVVAQAVRIQDSSKASSKAWVRAMLVLALLGTQFYSAQAATINSPSATTLSAQEKLTVNGIVTDAA